MGSSYESNGHANDLNVQIVRHPSFQPYSVRSSSSWLDVRVFYVRISSFLADEGCSFPESLTLNHIPLSPQTTLELNSRTSSSPRNSRGKLSCILRRDRMDKKSEEATFVTTDSVRLNGSAKFEVFDRDDLLISGVLEMSSAGESRSNNNASRRSWSMSCEAAGSGFSKGKKIADSLSPTVEVYVAGCFSGFPIILTRNLQVGFDRRKNRMGRLDSIPEYERASEELDGPTNNELQVAKGSYKAEEEEEYESELYWRQMEGEEDGEQSWFDAGVRVGVGIGLGICVGIGIGVGLLVRTYQTTSKTFKRRLM